MTNLIQNAKFKHSSINDTITAFINALNARDPAVYRIIEWIAPQDGFGGSVTLTGSRSFKNLKVSQVIAFEGLRSQYFHRFSVSHIANSQKEVTLEYTDRNTFNLIADGCIFFEGKAIASNTKSSPSGLDYDNSPG